MLGETLIFDRQLSAGEVQSLFSNPGPFYDDGGLVAGYLVNEGSGTTLYDISGDGNNATLSSILGGRRRAGRRTWPLRQASTSASPPPAATRSRPFTMATILRLGPPAIWWKTSSRRQRRLSSSMTTATRSQSPMSGTVGTAVDWNIQDPGYSAHLSNWSVTVSGSTLLRMPPGGEQLRSFTPRRLGDLRRHRHGSGRCREFEPGHVRRPCQRLGPWPVDLRAADFDAGLVARRHACCWRLSASVSNPVGDYSYQWSVTESGSSTPVASGIGSSFDFTPESSGSYTVSLSASDAYGQTLSSSGAFSATPVAPSAIFRLPGRQLFWVTKRRLPPRSATPTILQKNRAKSSTPLATPPAAAR